MSGLGPEMCMKLFLKSSFACSVLYDHIMLLLDILTWYLEFGKGTQLIFFFLSVTIKKFNFNCEK